MIAAARSPLILLVLLSVHAVLGANARPVAARDVASPAPGLVIETLLETAFPGETIPEREPRIFFVRLRYRPGATFDQPAVAAAEHVVSGSLVVRSRGEVVVHRGSPGSGSDAAVEALAPGREATLAPGDVAVSLTPGAAQTLHNPGATTATTLKVLVVATSETAGALPRGFATYVLGHLSTRDWQRSALPVGPVRVRVERVTAAPGMHAPLAATALPTLRYVDAGELEWAIESPATLLAPMPPTVRFRRGQTIPYQPQPAGRQWLLHNSGDEPLVLPVLSVMPG